MRIEVFRIALEKLPIVFDKYFNNDDNNVTIKTLIYDSRNVIQKYFHERGDSTARVLPLLGIKVISIDKRVDGALNSFVLRTEGQRVAQDIDGNNLYFRGREVTVNFNLTLFTNNEADIYDVISTILNYPQRRHFSLKADPGVRFPTTVALDDDSLQIPEFNPEGDITSYEFEIIGRMLSYTGEIISIPPVRTIDIGGGTLVQTPDANIVTTDDIDIEMDVNES